MRSIKFTCVCCGSNAKDVVLPKELEEEEVGCEEDDKLEEVELEEKDV